MPAPAHIAKNVYIKNAASLYGSNYATEISSLFKSTSSIVISDYSLQSSSVTLTMTGWNAIFTARPMDA